MGPVKTPPLCEPLSRRSRDLGGWCPRLRPAGEGDAAFNLQRAVRGARYDRFERPAAARIIDVAAPILPRVAESGEDRQAKDRSLAQGGVWIFDVRCRRVGARLKDCRDPSATHFAARAELDDRVAFRRQPTAGDRLCAMCRSGNGEANDGGDETSEHHAANYLETLMNAQWTIGIIGGSGLYAIDGLEDAEWRRVETPWGDTSDEILFGRIGNVGLRFLPRHGRGHRISPSDIPARANIDALKRAGCTDLLAISSVGSLREELSPGHFVMVDQFIDRTVARPVSFFGTGMVAHVSMADPVCERLSAFAAAAVASAGGHVAHGATYLAMEGPQFSTRAESRMFRQWGCDVIGMTAMPEARPAREAELPYALIGMVTDYDCWREDEAPVDGAAIVAQMAANGAIARATVKALIAALPEKRTPSPIDRALDGAIFTASDRRDPALATRNAAILSRLTS